MSDNVINFPGGREPLPAVSNTCSVSWDEGFDMMVVFSGDQPELMDWLNSLNQPIQQDEQLIRFQNAIDRLETAISMNPELAQFATKYVEKYTEKLLDTLKSTQN